MIRTLFRRLLVIPAAIIDCLPPLVGGQVGQLGLADWCLDRELGDPQGKLLQTRKEAFGGEIPPLPKE